MFAKGFYRRINTPGQGGWKCACCAPAPGKPKKKAMRNGKKKENKLFSALIAAELKSV